jgi:hypothetical protein
MKRNITLDDLDPDEFPIAYEIAERVKAGGANLTANARARLADGADAEDLIIEVIVAAYAELSGAVIQLAVHVDQHAAGVE